MKKAPLASNQVFIIKKSESLSTIANRLAKENLIRHALVFKIFVQTKGLTKRIQAGSYQLNSSLNVGQIAAILIRGPADLWLTFPEGWRKEEVALRLSANLNNFDRQGFLSLANNLEGKLFPDTYLIPLDASSSAVIEMFFENFTKKTKELDLSLEDLILASIIEREAKTDDDRLMIAGILKKRLQKNWPLQADATIQYALGTEGDWWPQLSKTDLAFSSPYNTYKNKGLPPTPICNPGLASIKAVLNPAQTPFWFYLSDTQGQIHYARTSEEHLQNIAKYLR